MMKTPDEIKKSLEACGSDECHGHHTDCHYEDDLFCTMHICGDARAYIQQLEHSIDALTEKVAQLKAAQSKWISVEDRLPNVGEKVMISGVKNGMQVGAFRGLSHPGENRKWWWKKNTILEVTHWMSLPSMPEPPKEEER